MLPHCTGDHHVGDAVTRYGAREVVHHGYANVTRLTERLIATFADARRVSVTGFSAGGVGAAGNYHQIARAFESIGGPTPYFVDDAGPFLRNEYLDDFAQNRLRESWNLDATVGTYCPECLEEGVHRVYEANARLHPAVRASLLCAYEDSVVATLYSVMNRNAFTGARLRRGLGDLADSLHTADGFRVFFYAGARHGALHEPLSSTAGLSDFLTAQVTDATWDSVRP